MELLNKIQHQLNVPKSLFNKFGGYNYRSAEQILEAVKPLLGKGTLTLSDEVFLIGQRYYVKATATIKDGGDEISVSAYARETESRKGTDDAQITGSASSYARKYALNGLFGLSDVQDPDDMNNTGAGSTSTTSVSHTTHKPYTPTSPAEVKQQAQQAKEEIGQRFEQPQQQAPAQQPVNRPAPTQQERQVLRFLSEFWASQIKSPNVKLDANMIMDALWSILGHYPVLDECTKIKDPNSPFFVPLESITKVVS
jgi:hypothetical protein